MGKSMGRTHTKGFLKKFWQFLVVSLLFSLALGVGCATAVAQGANKMYVVNMTNNALASANLDGTGGTGHGTCSGMINAPQAMAIDVDARKLYVVNAGTTGSGDDAIIRMNLDGTSCENLGNLNGTLYDPTGIALDVAAGKMYVTNSTNDTISRANLDGTGGVSLGNLNGTLDEPHGVALDLVAGKMYVANYDGWTVSRANLDGTGGESLGNLNGTLADPDGIALDVAAGKMYVLNRRDDTVRRANLDGTCPENLGNFNGTLNGPYGLVVDLAACKMYVANYGNSTVSRANLDGTSGVSLGNLNGNLDGPAGIVLGPSQLTTSQLTVTKAGTGAGTVTSNPAGIDCGATCSAAFSQSTPVTLTAVPNAISVLAGWSGCDSATDNQCIITMNTDRNVTATFSPKCNYDTETELHLPKSKKALILTPYHHTGFVGHADNLETALKTRGWKVQHYKDDQVTIPRMDEWLDEGFGLIHVTTHGSYRHIPLSVFDSEAERDNAYAILSAHYGSTIIKGHSQEAKYYIGIINTFIYNYCISLGEHPLIYLEGCYMASSDPDLREAFLCKGAGAYVGFDDKIGIDTSGGWSWQRTAGEVSRDFYNYLLNLGYTVMDARQDTDPGHHGDCKIIMCKEKVYLQSYGRDESLILEYFTRGDVNGDGAKDILDVRLCLQIALGYLKGTAAQHAAADVNGDGQVTREDAEILAARIIGM